MPKLKSLEEFKQNSGNILLGNNKLAKLNGGAQAQTSTSEEVSTDVQGQWETDCGTRETFDNGLVITWIPK